MDDATHTPEDVRSATGRFADALAGAVPSAAVPGCPGWTVVDLVTHLGNVHAWATRIVQTGQPAASPDGRPEPDALREWYVERAGALVDALAASNPDDPCWNFAGVGPTKGFWRRRQVHETLMHLVDLDQAHGRATALDPAICADGVAETLEVFLPRLHERGFAADLTGPVSLVATDTGSVWTLVPVDGSHPRTLTGADPVPDRVVGTAEQLLLRLWNRGADVAVEGDRGRVGRLLASRLSA